MVVKQSELTVITKAKELCSYVLTISDKSPKKFRFTLSSRLQNYSISIVEQLLYANEVRMAVKNTQLLGKRLEMRRNFQQQAFTDMKMLAYLSQLAMEQQCILPRQYEQITKGLYDCQNLLGAWPGNNVNNNNVNNDNALVPAWPCCQMADLSRLSRT